MWLPILPISDGNGRLVVDALAKVFAVMSDPLSPDLDSKARHMALNKAADLLPPGTPINLTAGDLADLLEAARSKQPDIPKLALFAHTILWINLACSAEHPELTGRIRHTSGPLNHQEGMDSIRSSGTSLAGN